MRICSHQSQSLLSSWNTYLEQGGTFFAGEFPQIDLDLPAISVNVLDLSLGAAVVFPPVPDVDEVVSAVDGLILKAAVSEFGR